MSSLVNEINPIAGYQKPSIEELKSHLKGPKDFNIDNKRKLEYFSQMYFWEEYQ